MSLPKDNFVTPSGFPVRPASPLGPLGSLGPVQPLTYMPAGREIYVQGEIAKNLYQVEFGAVRLYRLFADGRRQIMAFYLPGEVFGFEADGIHHFFAEAIGPAGIRSLRIPDENDLQNRILPLALRGMVHAQEHLLVLGRHNAVERVAVFLLDMADRQGGLKDFDLPMPRLDIADYLGLTIETISRVLTRLRQEGTIRLPGLRKVEIVSWRRLREMSQ